MNETLPALNREKIDAMVKAFGQLKQVDAPLTHSFVPGFYVRTIFMPKGSLIISRIHKTTHPFWVTKGHCAVWDEESGVKQIKAGHVGITTPGTLRVLYMHEDTVWTTFHAGDWPSDTDPEKIVNELTEIRDVSNAPELDKLLIGDLKQLPQEKKI